MGWLRSVKDIFTKVEVTEETFEYESIDHYLQQHERVRQMEGLDRDVAQQCDQVVEATYQMEDLQVEYDMVTSYFEDIQTIEEMPGEARKQLSDIARRIALLEGETTQFLQSDDRISDENFRMIRGMEKQLTSVFGQLKELEDMDMKLRRDMTYLEGEKHAQEYTQELAQEQQERLKRLLIGFGVASVLAVITLAVIGVVWQAQLVMPILLILLVVAGMAAAAVVAYRRLSYEFQLAQKKENRAIALMNKVKIRYVNNTSTLQYLYEKYHVHSLRELEYLYDQYQKMVDEVRKYQRTTGDLHECMQSLSGLLRSYGVRDPEIWTRQTPALTDAREMVEVKHSLNVRRQKLRDQIAYNEQLRLDGLKGIRELLKTNPELAESVRRELAVYHIDL